MELKLVLLIVLLELSSGFSFYISQVNNQPAVYEVKEDKTTNTLTITSPQSEKPVLREIIYYHIIEKPYEQVIKHNNITNNTDITHITNKNENKLSEDDNFTANKYITSRENTTDKDNDIVIESDFRIINNDGTESSHIDNNTGNITESYNEDQETTNILVKKDLVEIKNRITDTDNITTNTNIIDNRVNDTITEKSNDTNHLSEKDENTVNPNNIAENKNIVESFVNVIDNESQTNNNFNNKNPTNLVHDKGPENGMENEKYENLNDIVTFNTSANINVIDKLINPNDDNIIQYNDISENTYNLTKGINTMNSNTNNINITFNANKSHSDEKLAVTITENYSTTHNYDSEIENIIMNDEVNRRKNEVANRESRFEFENETENKYEYLSTIAEISNGNYINSRNKDDNAFIIIVADDDDDNQIDKDNNHETYKENHETGTANHKTDKETFLDDNNIIDEDDNNNKTDNDNKTDTEKNTVDKNISIIKKDHNKIDKEINTTINDNNKIGEDKKITVNDNKTIDDDNNKIAVNDNKTIDEDNNINDKDTKINGNNNNIKDDINNFDYATTYDELRMYLENDYDNPYDGKEGVVYNKRLFTNGHGFQYFYPDPQNQEASEDPAPVKDSNANEVSNIPEEIDGHDTTINKLAAILDDNEEQSDINRRRKRGFATLFSFNEEYAPEDFFKNVMDKPSERVKRSLEREGTYGMTLTGNKGVVWNDFDGNKVFFPVGGDSKYVENKDRDDDSLRLRKNNVDDSIVKVTYYNNLEAKVEPEKQETNKTKRNTEEKMKEEYKEEKRERELSIEESNVQEPSILKSNNGEYTDGQKIVEFNTEELQLDKTFGMSLTSGQGRVWNDLGDNSLSYDVGEPTLKLTRKASKDDEVINKKIEAFHNFLNEPPSNNLRTEEPKIVRTSTENLIKQEPSTEKEKITTKKPISNKQSTEKPKAVQPNTDAQIILKPKIHEFEEPKVKESSGLDKTYGMSLTGDQGIVWNDLNGRRVSYRVGDENIQTSKLSKDDELINKKIEQFQKNIKAESNVEPKIEESSTEPNIDKPTTEFPKIEPHTEEPEIPEPTKIPIIEPLTEEPIIYEPISEEPKTNRPIVIGPINDKPTTNRPIVVGPITDKPTTTNGPIVVEPINENPTTDEPSTEASSSEGQDEPVKTYGMSLTGDSGIVWNDLNGDRISYHVGEADKESEEDENSEIATNSDLQGKPQPIGDKIENSEEYLLNENDVLKEIEDILTEFSEETEKSKNDTSKAVANKIVDIVKEVLKNETEKLQNKLNDMIKEEVAKQIEAYFTTYNETKPSDSSGINNSDEEINENGQKIIGKNEKNLEKESKKRKECDKKKEKKEDPIKIVANNIYGNSVGNGNVTNIFIFNINNASDIDNMKLPNNGTDGVFAVGNDTQKPVEEEIKEEHKEEETATETVTKPEEAIIDTTKNPEENTDTNNPHGKDSNEIDNNDLNENESGEIIAESPKPNEATSEIPEEDKKDTSTEKVTNPDVSQGNNSDQATENSEEHTEYIANESNEPAENNNEYTNDSPEENEIEDTSAEKIASEPDFVLEDQYNNSEQNDFSEEEINNTLEDRNYIREEERFSYEENDGILEKETDDIPESEESETEDIDIEIDVRANVPTTSTES